MDPAVWLWINGASGVNARTNFSGEFIHAITKEQYKLRYGDASDAFLGSLAQTASNDLGLNVIRDVLYGIQQRSEGKSGQCYSPCAGEWLTDTVKMLVAHTINLHLKDYVIVPDPYGVGVGIHGCSLGQGRTDCRAVLDAMPTLDMSAIFEHGLTTCTLRAGTNTVGSPRACSTPATN